MHGPYDLSGGRSIADVLPRYASRERAIGQGPYEPVGLILQQPPLKPTPRDFEDGVLRAWQRSETSKPQPTRI